MASTKTMASPHLRLIKQRSSANRAELHDRGSLNDAYPNHKIASVDPSNRTMYSPISPNGANNQESREGSNMSAVPPSEPHSSRLKVRRSKNAHYNNKMAINGNNLEDNRTFDSSLPELKAQSSLKHLLSPSQDRSTLRSSNNISPTSSNSNNDKASIATPTNKKQLGIGLENLGNTCFMNASLQCLLHIQPLVSYFLQRENLHKELNPKSPTKGTIANSFQQLIREIKKPSSAVVSPTNFQKAVCVYAPYLMDFQQQDSQEFLRFLLNSLAEDLCRPVPPEANTSPTHNRKRVDHTANSGQKKDPFPSNKSPPVLPLLLAGSTNGKSAASTTPALSKSTTAPSTVAAVNSTEMPDRVDRLAGNQERDNLNPNPALSGACPSSSSSSSNRVTSKRSASEKLREETRKMREAFSSGTETDDGPSTGTSTGCTGTGAGIDINGDGTHTQGSSENVQSDSARQADVAWQRYLKLNGSIVTDIFAGQLQSSIMCLTCRSSSLSFDPFLDLSVPIGDTAQSPGSRSKGQGQGSEREAGSSHGSSSSGRVFGSNAASITLEKCIEKFTAEEILDGDNMYLCEKCKKKRKSVKRLTLYKWPQILVIHIKRFNNYRAKISTDVRFPLSGLDLTRYITPDHPQPCGGSCAKSPTASSASPSPAPETDSPGLDRTFSTVSDNNGNISSSSSSSSSSSRCSSSSSSSSSRYGVGCGGGGLSIPMYDLVGVANHQGSLQGGHYVAHVDTNSINNSNNSSSTGGVSNNSSSSSSSISGGSSSGSSNDSWSSGDRLSRQNWMCFNDSRVSSISASSVNGPTAYVLFYRIRET